MKNALTNKWNLAWLPFLVLSGLLAGHDNSTVATSGVMLCVMMANILGYLQGLSEGYNKKSDS
jgi:hypothetical protein